ncbi:DUF2871 family protein [uncultured Pseudoflavonifractor sp.]|uniref:DUF2871 family protein n=1 Tax=uncultured Pseudoflavonifractor sp. TaxID=1221379 RepID=UPI0025EA5577|nr:DUF2871 family protein [uncultured Pseudoflavonifractor sp.]
MKRYANTAVAYAVIAMIFGVFYREFTKFNGFTGRTVLSAIHPHYFVLGVAFFLLLLLLEKAVGFSGAGTGKVLAVYHVGLNLTGLTLLLWGVVQVLGTSLSSALNGALSGVAGIGHILLGISLLLILLQIRKSVSAGT